MRPYSLDLRQRVLQALQDGQSQRAIAARFALALATVQRYARQFRERQDLTPQPIPGRPRTLSAEKHEELAALVASRSDWTLERLAQAWQEQAGQKLSAATMHRTLRRIGYAYKKRAASLPNAMSKSAPLSEKR